MPGSVIDDCAMSKRLGHALGYFAYIDRLSRNETSGFKSALEQTGDMVRQTAEQIVRHALLQLAKHIAGT